MSTTKQFPHLISLCACLFMYFCHLGFCCLKTAESKTVNDITDVADGKRRTASKPIVFVEGKTVAEVFFSDIGDIRYCRLHELEEPSDAEVLLQNLGLPVKRPSFKVMLQLVTNCSHVTTPSQLNSTESPADLTSWSPWALWNGIMPGTKWCGVGDIASSFEELGSQSQVDSCCRAHDHCPIKLKGFRAGYGLVNLSFYTKSHCDCDREFYSCLKESKNKFADSIGKFYFNFMRVQCLKDHRPFICAENRTELNGIVTCSRWTEDPNSTKMHVTLTDLKY